MIHTLRALTLLLAISHQTVSAEQVVRLAIGEWQPYLSENSPHYGFATHIITESFAQSEVTVEYGFFPWKRAYQASLNGTNWDGTAVWLHNKDRAAHFFYSDPVVPTSTSIFHLSNIDFNWNSIDDLAQKKIGVTLGYSYGPEFDSAVINGTLTAEQSPNDLLNIRKLLRGRIDLLLGENIVMYSLLRESFSEGVASQITHHSKPLLQNFQYLLLSRSNPENSKLIELFNSGLAKLKRSGRYDQILADGLAGKYASQGSNGSH